MNYNRIISLLKYDWTINKKKLGLALTLITIVYFTLVILYFVSKNVFHVGVDPSFPVIMSSFINGYFEYAQLAMVFVVTSILHQKFTNPRSATQYLSLPGTSAEKYTVMLADYLLGALAVLCLHVVCHFVTMGVCWIVSPEVNWLINPLNNYIPIKNIDQVMLAMEGRTWNDALDTLATELDSVSVADTIVSMVNSMIWFAPVIGLVELFAYVCLNMCFRTNGQLKSIAIFFAAGFIFSVITVIGSVVVFSHDLIIIDKSNTEAVKDAILGDVMAFFNIVKIAAYFSPVVLAGLAYLFYKQVCKKQAK